MTSMNYVKNTHGFVNQVEGIWCGLKNDHFPFLAANIKIKNVANSISKIDKDHFFAFEEEMKNDVLFLKGKTRFIIEMCARGKKYTGIHSIRKYSKTFAPLQTGVW